MASIIVALFDCPDEANRVAEGLTGAGVARDDVYLAGGEPTPTRSEIAELTDTLAKLGVPEDDARNYGDGIAGGGALLLVRAEEETAARVRGLIERTAHGGSGSADGGSAGDTASPAGSPECDSTQLGQVAGGYGTRGAATAFGGIERVPARSHTADGARRADIKH